MIDLHALERDHVLDAIDAYTAAGGAAFLAAHGADESRDLTLSEQGRSFDALAIVGIAYGLATGRTLARSELVDHTAKVHSRLTALEFTVSPLSASAPRRAVTAARGATPTRQAAGRSTASARAERPAPKSRVAASDRTYNVCPTCFMAIPSTGVCDNCG